MQMPVCRAHGRGPQHRSDRLRRRTPVHRMGTPGNRKASPLKAQPPDFSVQFISSPGVSGRQLCFISQAHQLWPASYPLLRLKKQNTEQHLERECALCTGVRFSPGKQPANGGCSEKIMEQNGTRYCKAVDGAEVRYKSKCYNVVCVANRFHRLAAGSQDG